MLTANFTKKKLGYMCRARSVAVSTFSIPTSLATYLYLYDDQIRLHCDDNQIIGCSCADYHSGGRDSGIDIRVKRVH